MESGVKITCDKCKEYGFKFCTAYGIKPNHLIEGNPKADIWIIGLNPKDDKDYVDDEGYIEKRDIEGLRIHKPNNHNYFQPFRTVSENLFANWESENSNVAHTDLVKCASKTFPDKSKIRRNIIANCIEYLKWQIEEYKPKMIICNGSDVCNQIIRIYKPQKNDKAEILTSYCVNTDDHKMWIVLSGFVGRIDNRNRRRLGKEIEEIIEKANIEI